MPVTFNPKPANFTIDSIFETEEVVYTGPTVWNNFTSLSTTVGVKSTGLTGVQTVNMTFKPDGTKLYVLNYNSNVYQYSLLTPWDISTLVSDGISYTPSQTTTTSRTFFMNSTGTKIYIGGFAGPIYQYALSTPWVISSATYEGKSLSHPAENTGLGTFMDTAGLRFYLAGNTSDTISQWSLSSAYDISTNSSVGNLNISARDNVAVGVHFNSTGTKMILVGSQFDALYMYTLSTPWLVSSAVWDGTSKSVSILSLNPQAVWVTPDGTSLFLLESATNTVKQLFLV